MNPTTEQAATRIIEALVEDRALFSAHDVTTLLRAEGLTVRHTGQGGVREFVHNIMNQGNPMFDDYIRTASSIGAFVYHHYNDDVNDYDPDEHRQATNITTGTAVGSPTTTVGAPTVNVGMSSTAPLSAPVDDKVGVDQRGRLCVRASLLRQLNVVPGDLVFVNTKLNGVVKPDFTNPSMVTDPAYRWLKVDKDNCVRISSGLLNKMFGDTRNDRYELKFGSNSKGEYIEIV